MTSRLSAAIGTVSIAFSILLLSDCAGISPPTERQLLNASRLFPGMTAEELFEGKRLYHRKCGSCHVLYQPESRSAALWDSTLDGMATKVRLTEEESVRIRRYLKAGASSDTSARE